MKKTLAVLLAIACCSTLTSRALAQDPDQATSDAVIAMVKAQWASEMKNPSNIADQMKDLSADYTEFNSDYATRIDGKDANARLAEGSAKGGTKTAAAEMINPKVQVFNGDTAILTYNYAGVVLGKDGKAQPTRAKSTRVYVKKDNKWVLVHANFGADPVPQS